MSYENPYDPYGDDRRSRRGQGEYSQRSGGSGNDGSYQQRYDAQRQRPQAGSRGGYASDARGGAAGRGGYGNANGRGGYGNDGRGASGARSNGYGQSAAGQRSQAGQRRQAAPGQYGSDGRGRSQGYGQDYGRGASRGNESSRAQRSSYGNAGSGRGSYAADPNRGASRGASYGSGRANASRGYAGDDARQRRSATGRGRVRDGRQEVPQLAGHEKGRKSYSRYDSAQRYSAAARDRSKPRRRAGGPSKAAGILASLPLPGARRRSGKVHTNSYTKSPARRIDFAGARPAIIGVLCVAVCAIVAILLWSNRKVNITLNGEEFSIRVGSTCEQVISAAELEPKAGNLVSVSGKTLEEGAGYTYTATVGGNELSNDDAEQYRVGDGDTLDISDGGDRMEEYDVQVVDEQPKLEMGGDSMGNISYVSQWPSAGQYEMRTGKQSGETARGDTLTETKNAVITVHQISPDDGRRLVALTFDDGPAEKYTEAYLEILTKYGIHATFYNLGQNVEAHPDLCKKIVEQGSEIQSHTYQHQQLTTLDAASLQSEFSNAFSDIQENAGVTTTAFRPPYGSFDEKAWLNSGGLASVSVLWNQDSLDWKLPGADAIVENCLKYISSGSIILMHDGGGNRDQDVEALPQLIEKLQAEGYEFVTVSELMKSDSSIPADIATCSASLPEGSVWPTEIKSDDDTTSSDSSSSDTAASA